jgi:hypothetical protein
MDRSLAMLLIGLVFGGGIGFAVASTQGTGTASHDHANPAHHAEAATTHDGHAAHADALSLPADAAAPTLDIDLQRDPVAGWNLHLRTTNFTFAPERASQAHVPGEGHAHVYANGVKIGRFYGPWIHLGGLPAGQVAIEVTLNANDHRPLAVGDRPVSVTRTIEN